MSNLFGYLRHPHRRRGAARPPAARAAPRPPGRDRARATSRSATRARTSWALRDLDLTIAPGEKLGLVGENGAGQEHAREAAHAALRSDRGRDPLRRRGPARHGPARPARADRRACSRTSCATSSRPPRTSASATPPPSRTAARIAEAARRGGAAGVVEALPKGYDTVLGGWFEAGHEISAGQWQKLAVARAFMREDAEVLILDEPTAAIDAEARARAVPALQGARGGPDRDRHLAPLLDRAHRRPDRRAPRRPARGARHAPRARRARRALRPPLPPAGAGLPRLSGARGGSASAGGAAARGVRLKRVRSDGAPGHEDARATADEPREHAVNLTAILRLLVSAALVLTAVLTRAQVDEGAGTATRRTRIRRGSSSAAAHALPPARRGRRARCVRGLEGRTTPRRGLERPRVPRLRRHGRLQVGVFHSTGSAPGAGETTAQMPTTTWAAGSGSGSLRSDALWTARARSAGARLRLQ